MKGDKCVVLGLVPLRGEKNFKPHPQNRILMPIRGSFQISDKHPAVLFDGSPCELLMISLDDITRRAG